MSVVKIIKIKIKNHICHQDKAQYLAVFSTFIYTANINSATEKVAIHPVEPLQPPNSVLLLLIA